MTTMNDNDIIFTSTLTVATLREMLGDDVVITPELCSSIEKALCDAVVAVINDLSLVDLGNAQ